MKEFWRQQQLGLGATCFLIEEAQYLCGVICRQMQDNQNPYPQLKEYVFRNSLFGAVEHQWFPDILRVPTKHQSRFFLETLRLNCQYFHLPRILSKLYRSSIYLFFFNRLLSKLNGGFNIFSFEMRILIENLINSYSLSKHFKDKLNSDTCAADDRFTDHDFRVCNNALLVFHGCNFIITWI